MSEITPRLGLPLIAAGQAQKHVPVNEALSRLDALVQISVLARNLIEPPADPQAGDRYVVAPSATGDWAGQDGTIAAYDAGWSFTTPADGWLAWDTDAEEFIVRTGGSWRVFAAGGGRELLAADRTYYVRTDGSDANDGLADSAVGAFQTLQKAVDIVAALDISVHDVTIRIAEGAYATGAGVALKSLTGSGVVTILGDISAPLNVVLSTNGTVSALDAVINATGVSGKWRVRGVRFTSTATGTRVGLQSAIGSCVEFDSVDFGSGLHYQIRASDGGAIRASGDYSISAGAIYHILAGQTGLVRLTDLALTLSGTPEFSGAFIRADQCAVVIVGGVTFSGQTTGARYLVQLNGIINTGDGGAEHLPGDSSGSALTGGQYI